MRTCHFLGLRNLKNQKKTSKPVKTVDNTSTSNVSETGTTPFQTTPTPECDGLMGRGQVSGSGDQGDSVSDNSELCSLCRRQSDSNSPKASLKKASSMVRG